MSAGFVKEVKLIPGLHAFTHSKLMADYFFLFFFFAVFAKQ